MYRVQQFWEGTKIIYLQMCMCAILSTGNTICSQLNSSVTMQLIINRKLNLLYLVMSWRMRGFPFQSFLLP